MKLIKQLVYAVVICGLAVPAFAAEPRVVGWDDLAPEPVQYDDPFSELSPEQLRALRKILRFEQSNDSGDNAITSKEATALRAELEADGLDVDWLFEQRKIIMETRQRIATATNDELLGQSVRIPGYLLPLEINNRKAVEFLLVPTVGACIHTPAPPANQIVHVRYPDGFEIEGLYTPIWVSGALGAEDQSQTVRYSDGEALVETSYAIDADTVERY